MIRVVLYTSGDECVDCRLVKRVLIAAGVQPLEIDLRRRAKTPAPLDSAHRAVEANRWFGYLPDAVRAVADRIQSVPAAGED
ncbi:hypothetical protein [Microbacterium sp. F2]|uniref:hypothetical protein n=1 Tax=Microbacterium sp. F2 TaxID=3422228 RepID=UPI003FD5C56C